MQSSKKTAPKGTTSDGFGDSGETVGTSAKPIIASREGYPEALAVGKGRMPGQVWTVSYVTRVEIVADTWFEANEKAELQLGIPRSRLSIEMGTIK